MRKIVFILVFALLFMSSFAFAEISISAPLNVYNIGDKLYISINSIHGMEIGNLNVNLVCGNSTVNLARIPARSFSADEYQSYAFYKLLNKDDLGIENLSTILGSCQTIVSIGESTVSTKTFTISNSISVSASVDKESYNPGEAIIVSVKASEANGNTLNGIVDGSNATTFNKVIKNGVMSEIFSMPETAEAGEYHLNIEAYNLGKNGILNRGNTSISFKINQIASSVVLSLSNTKIMPSENLTVGANIFDQSGGEMNGVISLGIISPNGKTLKLTIQNGNFSTTNFAQNSSAGTWKVVALFNGVSDEREFDVPRVQKVKLNLSDSVLTIANIGNTIYNQTINVKVGNKSTKLDLNIAIGETRKFNLKAPKGEYNIVVGTGKNSISGVALLTGNVISIDDLKNSGGFGGYLIVWIFLMVILGGAGAVFFIRYRKTKLIKSPDAFEHIINKNKKGYSLQTFSKKQIQNSKFGKNNSPKSMVDLTSGHIGNAESSLVLDGEKYMSSVVALNIQNYGTLSEVAKESLHAIIEKSKNNKGLIDSREDHVFIVFSPIMTKTYNNEILAAKTGMEILKELRGYNKKFKDKIKFNIGIHAGELIASKDGGRLKYTSIGNTISLAKRIASSDTNKLIVSESIKNKINRDLKISNTKEINGNKTYEVSEIKDKAADAERLKDLLKRAG